MQYSFSAVALMALVGFAQAQIPACATTCISDAVSSSTSCGATDLACQCEESNQSAITAAATSCVLTACGDQALTVLSAAQAACAAVPASSASSSLASLSSVASSVAASVSSVVESASSGSISSTTVVSTSTAYTTSAIPSVTISSTPVPSSSTATTTSAPVQATNAAGQLAVGAGSLFAAGVAVLAAL